jgi:hypothetical protein
MECRMQLRSEGATVGRFVEGFPVGPRSTVGGLPKHVPVVSDARRKKAQSPQVDDPGRVGKLMG